MSKCRETYTVFLWTVAVPYRELMFAGGGVPCLHSKVTTAGGVGGSFAGAGLSVGSAFVMGSCIALWLLSTCSNRSVVLNVSNIKNEGKGKTWRVVSRKRVRVKLGGLCQERG